MYTDLSRETERRSTMKILIAVVTICCIVFHCKGIAVTLQNLTDFYGLNGNPVLMECILNAGNFNAASQRRWLRDGVTLFSNGISSSAGNGYSETFGTDRFGLQTPILDRSFNGSTYQCVYGFFQSTLYMKIAVIEGMKKSSGDCIKGISIETCSFSLSNVIPEINQQNLTVYYKDDTVEDVTSMLTVTSQVNTDGSRAYQFKIVQVPGTISMDVKILSLFFMVDIYPTTLNITMIPVGGLTTPSSTINSDMPTTVSEPLSTISSDMPTTVSEPLSTISLDMSTTVSEAPLLPITTPAGLSQEIVIVIVISVSSALAAGALILLIVLVVRQCRRKCKRTTAKNKENHFANKQNNLTKRDDLKSNKPRKFKLSEKRNTKLGSTSLSKKKDAPLKNYACKDRMYLHYPQTTDYWNDCGNQHVFNNSHNVGNMMLYGNRHDNDLQPNSRLNNRMRNQSHYPEYPGHNEGMFKYYRADSSYRGQQMYQRPYNVVLYDTHIIVDKQDDKRSSKRRPYEKNWDLLY